MSSEIIARDYAYCEEIAQRNRPYLYLVARYFNDRQKYKAFCSTYASMRTVDDQIDSIPYRGRLNDSDKSRHHAEIDKWLENIEACASPNFQNPPIYAALQDSLKSIKLPLFPWRNLAEAMKKDVGRDSFQDFEEFVQYSEGAAIAPATVFMFLLTARKVRSNYIWEYSDREIYQFARELALFCYLTHIIRDVSSDLELSQSGLLYISDKDLREAELDKTDLRSFKSNGNVNKSFKMLATKYIQRARDYEQRGRKSLQLLLPNLDKNCQFILSLLLEFYSGTLDKITKIDYNVFTGDEKLTWDEEKVIVEKEARKRGLEIDYV
jgi:phytoene synthase